MFTKSLYKHIEFHMHKNIFSCNKWNTIQVFSISTQLYMVLNDNYPHTIRDLMPSMAHTIRDLLPSMAHTITDFLPSMAHTIRDLIPSMAHTIRDLIPSMAHAKWDLLLVMNYVLK